MYVARRFALPIWRLGGRRESLLDLLVLNAHGLILL